ncbi:DNA-binding transcriptional ArsR family regulator [Inhella inkyongensis]|uniref:DNA-binding transcriptional ArsR family regulator n=1 Tax=Inhella inkyongensis TaxID=392593 RepID=A0A840S1P1_9BURK|nr:metalloregulator ArsR/SmtB family transcription factor [Inhella inkyongensis]MBB5205067.1 DNA-binding transcriptional ArsR family regulator [Inhella inkyongensis]
MNEEQVIKALAALAHGVRLTVFRALVVAGPKGLTPGVMQEGLGIPATTLSFHLKELSAAGLVAAERDGRSLIYRAQFDTMNGLLGYMTANCCQGSATCSPAASSSCCP